MSDSTQVKPKDTPSRAERVASFLERYRRVLLFSAIAIFAAIVLTIVLFQVQDNRMEQAAREAELISEDWSEWQNLVDTDQDGTPSPETLENRIRTRAESLLEDYPRSYGALRALYILSRLDWELSNYEAVRDVSLRIADDFSESHLAGIALANAAAAAEELNEREDARRFLDRIVDGAGDPTTERPRALFNLGRLSEDRGAAEEALEYYNRLVTDHPESNWTNLGRNRIIHLTSRTGGTDS